ncbi:MAG: hypothetical protein KJ630_23520 [Proteobacteria bacterium]|nr:hypothetical protein [Pseudomonadota bacterium]
MPDCYYCFWILRTNGNIIIPESRHINAVVAVPAAFDETDESIRRTFAYYNESQAMNHEGRAREAIMLRVINRNHIRIRKNQFRNNQNWAVQLYDLTEERKISLSRWANYILPFANDKNADVVLHQLIDNTKTKTILYLMAEEYSFDREETVIIPQSELLLMYTK